MTGDDSRCAAEVVSRRVPVHGRLMHARTAGRAVAGQPPVVLVHGLSISSRYFVPTLRCLGSRVEAVAPDLPGFGLSVGPSRPLDVPGLADAVVAWLDATRVERAILLGNSVGTQVALDIAVRYPDRVGGLVLTGLALGASNETLLRHLMDALVDAPREPLSLWPLQAVDFVAAGPRRVWATLRHALHDRIEPKLAAVSEPALVVRGGRDPFAPQWWIEEVARRMPAAEVVCIPDATHAVCMSEPTALAEVVVSFVGRARPPEPST
jgi:pimeloyl-ACP methyl ester carboxylesterase